MTPRPKRKLLLDCKTGQCPFKKSFMELKEGKEFISFLKKIPKRGKELMKKAA